MIWVDILDDRIRSFVGPSVDLNSETDNDVKTDGKELECVIEEKAFVW